MNRIIKFRIWNRKHLKFDYVNFLNLESLINPLTCIKDYFHNGYFADPENPNLLMQYTGIKDKHSKEIYEGDIVKILYYPWVSQSEYYVGHIVFEEECWQVDMGGGEDAYKGNGLCSIHPGNHGWIEIIGNIHQNSDLIQKDK